MKKKIFKGFILRVSRLTGLFILVLIFSSATAEERVYVGHFSQSDLREWKTRVFKGETVYSIATVQGQRLLKAESDGTASVLYKEMVVDLTATPYLNWSWRVDNLLTNIDEKTKAGDDYPARLYVVIKSAWLSLQPRSLNYVWSSVSQKGEVWPSAYSSEVKMMAVRSGSDQLHTLVKEKRNLQVDLEKVFGTPLLIIDGIAIMTDTDNSQGTAVAYFGDIYFTRE